MQNQERRRGEGDGAPRGAEGPLPRQQVPHPRLQNHLFQTHSSSDRRCHLIHPTWAPPPLLLLNPGAEHEDAILPQPGKPDSWATPGPFPGSPAGISLEVSAARVALRRGHCAAWHSSLCRAVPGSPPGPEAVVKLLHPGYHTDHCDVQGLEATPTEIEITAASPPQARPPAAASRTRSLRSSSAGTCRFTARCSVRLHKQLVVLGPRSTWQSSSGGTNITWSRGHWTHKTEAAPRLPSACRSHASTPTTARGDSPGKG